MEGQKDSFPQGAFVGFALCSSVPNKAECPEPFLGLQSKQIIQATPADGFDCRESVIVRVLYCRGESGQE